MKAQFVYESLNFERGQDPKTSMGIGKVANPIKIISVEEEQYEGGRVMSLDDVEKANENTWGNLIEDEMEIHYLLDNWEDQIDAFYGFWVENTDPENSFDNEQEYLHPSELEEEFVEYQGQTYKIPKTDIFKKISDTVPPPS